MNRLAQKYMSVICVGAVFMTTISTAGAVVNINPSDEIYYVTEEAVASTELGVGIAIAQGVKKLKDDISLPKYPDYIATEGKYGDIFDTTVYNKYCRVYYNVGQSVYVSGLLANGTFNYVKKGYTGIKRDSEVYNKVQNLFNICIASYSSNTMYDLV